MRVGLTCEWSVVVNAHWSTLRYETTMDEQCREIVIQHEPDDCDCGGEDIMVFWFPFTSTERLAYLLKTFERFACDVQCEFRMERATGVVSTQKSRYYDTSTIQIDVAVLGKDIASKVERAKELLEECC